MEIFPDRFRRRYGWIWLHAASEKKSDTTARSDSKKQQEFSSAKGADGAHLDPIIIDAISLSLELHGEATASRVDSNTPLCRGNADYHTGLI